MVPEILLSNPFSDKTLVVWLEAWGEDYWMRPGDAITIESDATGDERFEVSWREDGLVVWPSSPRGCTVRDLAGAELECGHQRPAQAGIAVEPSATSPRPD
ncbi:hypothetical protein DFR74_11435 [Nocardia puris]|uniref:Uncharacterized protein n=1 Tax=Nocardia puris TaxID=208602 RepID=A0A366D6B1_9NOCA|nr:hypothetical protein DFR74_11435 [Nocardia puris]